MCPSQWEGKLEDGRMFYCRFRWGGFYIRVSEKETDDVSDAVGGECILEMEYGGEMDGIMTTEEMKELTKDSVDWSGL